MSSDLHYAPGKRTGDSLPKPLKFALEKFYGDDRLTRGPELIEANTPAHGYLRGLAYCKVDGAKELLDAIEQYDSVSIWLEF